VKTVSDEPSVSIHLLANDTACVWRHQFDPSTGEVKLQIGLQQRAVSAGAGPGYARRRLTAFHRVCRAIARCRAIGEQGESRDVGVDHHLDQS
jgi:hypothetical protein